MADAFAIAVGSILVALFIGITIIGTVITKKDNRKDNAQVH